MNTAQVLSWIAGVFEEPADGIQPETALQDVAAWDSIGQLTLMAGLDSEFSVLLSDQDLRNMAKVGDIIEVLRTHGKIDGA